jgi:hypothetical protein
MKSEDEIKKALVGLREVYLKDESRYTEVVIRWLEWVLDEVKE